jgi:NAD(P)H dehydrogenase (quinone)
MKTVKYGISLCTAGHPNKFLKEIGISESMRNVMIDDRLGKRFTRKEMILLGGTLERKKVEKEHFETVKTIGKKIKKYCT